VRGEIIAIGDELTCGRVVNTTSAYAAARLTAAGHEVIAITTVGDDVDRIGRALLAALDRSEFVIVTGGLGATTDDLTNKAVIHTLKRPATFYPEIFRKIQEYAATAGPEVRLSLEKLAWLPKGAHALHTEAKSAGYFLVQDGKPVFFLPGVPHEMKELLDEAVLARLEVWDGADQKTVRSRLYRLFGLAETEVNRRLRQFEQGKGDLEVKIGYYPVFPEVHVSLSVAGVDQDAVEEVFLALDREIVSRLGEDLYGFDEETLELVVGRGLKDAGCTLALAESCTGGGISARITSVPGSSDYFLGGIVAYSNSLKQELLQVAPPILETHGAVSAACARAMAQGARAAAKADLALSVTGIAGPGGGTPEKPVGTVFMAMDDGADVRDFSFRFTGERWQVQAMASATALDLIRKWLVTRG